MAVNDSRGEHRAGVIAQCLSNGLAQMESWRWRGIAERSPNNSAQQSCVP